MTEKSFMVIMVGMVFILAFQGGVLALCAVFCLLGMAAMVWDEAKMETKTGEESSGTKKKTVESSSVGFRM